MHIDRDLQCVRRSCYMCIECSASIVATVQPLFIQLGNEWSGCSQTISIRYNVVSEVHMHEICTIYMVFSTFSLRLEHHLLTQIQFNFHFHFHGMVNIRQTIPSASQIIISSLFIERMHTKQKIGNEARINCGKTIK